MQGYSPTGFKILPPVVKNLIIINSLFFLATLVLRRFNIDLINILGLHYPGASGFKIYQFVTYMFMHGGWEHIFFNMFALWMFGNVVENMWGGKKFLVFYMLTGLGSAIVYIFWIHFSIGKNLDMLNAVISHPTVQGVEAYFKEYGFHLNAMTTALSQSDLNLFNHNMGILASGAAAPSQIQQVISFLSTYKAEMVNQMVVIGASGAIFGLLLAFGVMFPNERIFLIFFPVPIKAKWFVIGYGLFELFSGILNRPGDNVAHFAHVGGLLVGLLIIMYWKKKGHLFGSEM